MELASASKQKGSTWEVNTLPDTPIDQKNYPPSLMLSNPLSRNSAWNAVKPTNS